jgi:hypothetical protein
MLIKNSVTIPKTMVSDLEGSPKNMDEIVKLKLAQGYVTYFLEKGLIVTTVDKKSEDLSAEYPFEDDHALVYSSELSVMPPNSIWDLINLLREYGVEESKLRDLATDIIKLGDPEE